MHKTHFGKLLVSALVITLFLLPQAVFAISLREELLFSVVHIVVVKDDGDIAIGSGTTISKDGLILTNHHVITDPTTGEPASTITICYTISQHQPPRCAASAKVVASDEAHDLALLKPDKKILKNGSISKESFAKTWKRSGNNFYAAPFQNMNDKLMNILDPITIWGYPGVGGSTITVTKGYVSGFDVVEDEESVLIKFIKTDASINPGNSGGAAFDEWFSFIGVPSRAYQGQLGFIIPVQTAIEWLEILEKDKLVNTKKIDSVKIARFSFKDISKEDSFLNIAKLLRHLKIMNGYGDSTFQPERLLSYKEAVTILIAAKRLKSSDIQNYPWLQIKTSQENSSITKSAFYEMLSKSFNLPPYDNAGNSFITRRQAATAIFNLLAR